MIILSILFPIWTIDWETNKGKGSSFVVDYGPFCSEQEARWFWIMIKEKMKRKYENVMIYNKDTEEILYSE